MSPLRMPRPVAFVRSLPIAGSGEARMETTPRAFGDPSYALDVDFFGKVAKAGYGADAMAH